MLAAIIANQNAANPARTKSLTVGGLELMSVGTTPGQNVGVLLDSVRVVEAMHGRVSSMTFDVDDPLVSLTFAEGSEVRFHDITNDVPIFLGFVEAVTGETFGLGRVLTVTARGVESLLDWMVIPSVTILASTEVGAAAQQLVAACQGISYPLRAFGAGSGGSSTQANPIEQGGFTASTTTYDVTITGQTLRQALYAVNAAANQIGKEPYEFTVDFYGGLRVKSYASGEWKPSDWTDVTIDGTTTPKIGEGWKHITDHSQTVRQVYVQGGNANGTGLVALGTVVPGPTDLLSDTSSDNATKLAAIGGAYLAQRTVAVRGEVTVEDQLTIGAAGSERHAGRVAILTDASQGLSAARYVIGQIEKSFRGAAGEVWRITYGGHPPSLTGSLRKITRSLQ